MHFTKAPLPPTPEIYPVQAPPCWGTFPRMTKPPTKPPLQIKLRPETGEDLHFILSSWKRSFFDTLPWLPPEIYYPMISHRIDALRQSPRTSTTVACSPDDEDFIFGWSCRSPTHLHYIFVRQSFRGARVAARLSPPPTMGPIKTTHWTRPCERYASKHPGRLIYTPSNLPSPPKPG